MKSITSIVFGVISIVISVFIFNFNLPAPGFFEWAFIVLFAGLGLSLIVWPFILTYTQLAYKKEFNNNPIKDKS